MNQFGAPLPPPMRPGHIPRDDRHRYWWLPATISTCLSVVIMMICFGAMVLSAFATDSCNGPDSCPETFHHLDVAEALAASAVIATVVQWLPAYWSPMVLRIVLAIVPIVLGIIAVAMFLGTPVGK
ncbi:hypothetical protein [Nocardia sp. NPDC004722]